MGSELNRYQMYTMTIWLPSHGFLVSVFGMWLGLVKQEVHRKYYGRNLFDVVIRKTRMEVGG